MRSNWSVCCAARSQWEASPQSKSWKITADRESPQKQRWECQAFFLVTSWSIVDLPKSIRVICVCAGLSLWISSGPAAELPPSDGGGQREAEKTDGGGSCWTLWHRECGRGREGHRDGENRPAAEPAALPPSGDVLNCDMEHKGLCSREVLEVRAAGLWVNLAAPFIQGLRYSKEVCCVWLLGLQQCIE